MPVAQIAEANSFAGIRQIHTVGGPGERTVKHPPVADLFPHGITERKVSALSGVADDDELARGVDRQRLKQEAVHEGKDRCVRTDAEVSDRMAMADTSGVALSER